MALSTEELSRALDLAAHGNLEEARSLLAAFLARQEASRQDEMQRLKTARHDICNALSIAHATVDGMLDGIVPINDARLNRLREIVEYVGESVYGLTATR